jgi:predicted RNA-binding protein with PIN domain
MIELPPDVELGLVRGVGAYLRSTPAAELPARLRRVRNFRPQALGRHRSELIAVLDDPAMRALIGEWIRDGHTSLRKEEAELLRIAVDRPDGWEDKLARRSRPKTAARSAPARPADRKLEQERDKLRRARKAEQEVRAELKAERALSTRLRAEVKEARDEARGVGARARAAERALARAEAALDRERRRGARAVERGKGELERTRAELKAAGKAMTELRRKVAALEGNTSRPHARGVKPKTKPRRAGPRRALPVPKGRLQDDPGALEEWLDEPSVLLLVDGYNVTKSVGGFGELDLERQRELLMDGVTRLARRKKVDATVVFDGSDVAPGTRRRSRGRVRVEYSRPDESADDHLVALLEAHPPEPVVLVTSDRELQRRAARLQATIATSPQLLALIR